MATVRTASYFITKFVSGYAVKAVDMQDFAASISSIGATDLTAVNAAIAALQSQINIVPNIITQSGAVTIPDFTDAQKLLDTCEKIDIVYGDETTDTINFPATFYATSSNGKSFDKNKLNYITEQWIKSIGKTRWAVDKYDLGTPPVDTTAPTFVVNTVTGVGQTAATFNVRINEAGTVKWIVTASATPPSKSAILAGTGQVGSNHGSVTMISNVTNTASITGLTASTPYYLYFYAIDNASTPNETSVQSAISFTTSSTADTTPPTYNVQTVTSIAATTASFNVQINEAGTVYWMLTTSSTPPSKSAIVAGTGQVGSNHGAQSVTANSTAVISLTGLTGSTQYYLYSYAEDSASTPNQTAVQSSISVLTPTAYVFFDDFSGSDVSDITGLSPAVGGAYTSVDAGLNGGTNAISSGKLVCTGGSTLVYNSNISAISKTDIDFKAVIATPPNSPNRLLFTVSYINEANRILVTETGQVIQLTTAGGGVVLFNGTGSCIAGDYIRVLITGTTLYVFRNTDLLTTQTISNSAKGAKVGFIIQDAAATLDSVSAI